MDEFNKEAFIQFLKDSVDIMNQNISEEERKRIKDYMDSCKTRADLFAELYRILNGK